MSVVRRTETAVDDESPRVTRAVSIAGSAAAVFLVVGVLLALSPVGEGALEPATAGDGSGAISTAGGSGSSWAETLAGALERRPVGDDVRVISVNPQGWTTITTTLVPAQETRAARLCEAVRQIEEQLTSTTGRRVFVADRRGSALLAC